MSAHSRAEDRSDSAPPERSVALIGDLVGSRVSQDRREVHRRLEVVLDEVNEAVSPLVPLWIVAGDEFQGRFASTGEAVRATLLIRVGLLPTVDVRCGLGCGTASVLTSDPRVEDGPAWWAAREALEQVESSELRAALRGVRSAYAEASGGEGDSVSGPPAGAVNAALMTRDQLVSGLSERGLSVLRGLLAGRTQSEIAESEDISASAVSQRVRADGLQVLVAAHQAWKDVR